MGPTPFVTGGRSLSLCTSTRYLSSVLKSSMDFNMRWHAGHDARTNTSKKADIDAFFFCLATHSSAPRVHAANAASAVSAPPALAFGGAVPCNAAEERGAEQAATPVSPPQTSAP